jgi:Tfp pilus assembly protein PilO
VTKDIFHTQILILGLIDYLSDVFKNEANRKEIKDNLLASIQAVFTTKLVESPETSETFKSALAEMPADTSLDKVIESLQKSMQDKGLKFDPTRILRESAREILNDFVSKAQKPEIADQINGLLQ